MSIPACGCKTTLVAAPPQPFEHRLGVRSCSIRRKIPAVNECYCRVRLVRRALKTWGRPLTIPCNVKTLVHLLNVLQIQPHSGALSDLDSISPKLHYQFPHAVLHALEQE